MEKQSQKKKKRKEEKKRKHTNLLIPHILRPRINRPLIQLRLDIDKAGVDHLLAVVLGRLDRVVEHVAGADDMVVPLGERAVGGQGAVVAEGGEGDVAQLEPAAGGEVAIINKKKKGGLISGRLVGCVAWLVVCAGGF